MKKLNSEIFRAVHTLLLALLVIGCESIETTSTTRNAVCGNNTAELGETCDGIDLGNEGKSCASFGFAAGELSCNETCDGFDTSQCSSTQCGNNFQEGVEVCDGTDLLNQNCADLGFNDGVLACAEDCMSFDTTLCTSPNLSCGDNERDIGETCDGADLAGQSCETLGFNGGQLACQADCSGFDVTGCTADNSFCGNGTVENEEQCDGNNMNGATCTTLGYESGTLACYLNCQYDTTNCVSEPTCVCPAFMLGTEPATLCATMQHAISTTATASPAMSAHLAAQRPSLQQCLRRRLQQCRV